MSLSTFKDRWLVIGTESKIEDGDAEPIDTFGLTDRVRQGEKGIGRLSAAFLAPVTLVLSKTVRDRFAAVLVDWRLFENPFLLIEDIRIPIVEFDDPSDVKVVLKGMADIIRSNFGIAAAEAKRDPESRVARLYDGWKRLSDFEQSQNLGSATHDDVIAFWSQLQPCGAGVLFIPPGIRSGRHFAHGEPAAQGQGRTRRPGRQPGKERVAGTGHRPAQGFCAALLRNRLPDLAGISGGSRRKDEDGAGSHREDEVGPADRVAQVH